MDPFIGEIAIFPWGWAPKGWLPCEGQTLQIQQNQALYALLGIAYGGDGKTTFNLPDLRGRTTVGGLNRGVKAGAETVTLAPNQVPAHMHYMQVSSQNGTAKSVRSAIYAKVTSGENLYASMSTPVVPIDPTMIAPFGGGTAHNNMQPYLTLAYYIATVGFFPSRP